MKPPKALDGTRALLLAACLAPVLIGLRASLAPPASTPPREAWPPAAIRGPLGPESPPESASPLASPAANRWHFGATSTPAPARDE